MVRFLSSTCVRACVLHLLLFWSRIAETEFWEHTALVTLKRGDMETVPDTARLRRELLERLLTPDGSPREGLETERSLSTADVAALFQMTERAIRKLAAKGEVPHMRTLGGGRLLYPAYEIAALYTQVRLNSGLRHRDGRSEAMSTGETTA